MLSKRYSTMLLGAAAIAGLTTAANAAFVVDVRATSATGGAVVGPNGKVVDITNASTTATVSFDVFAVVSGNDGSSANDGILSFAGSFLTSDGGNVLGTLSAARSLVMLGTGGSNGRQLDLDGDGDLDVGSNTNSQANNFFSARATGAPAPVFGPETLVGTLTLTIDQLNLGAAPTAVNFRPRQAGTAGSWFEDGTQITSSAFSAGAPVLLQVIPEPATLSLIGLAGLGMLARRRQA